MEWKLEHCVGALLFSSSIKVSFDAAAWSLRDNMHIICANKSYYNLYGSRVWALQIMRLYMTCSLTSFTSFGYVNILIQQWIQSNDERNDSTRWQREVLLVFLFCY